MPQPPTCYVCGEAAAADEPCERCRSYDLEGARAAEREQIETSDREHHG